MRTIYIRATQSEIHSLWERNSLLSSYKYVRMPKQGKRWTYQCEIRKDIPSRIYDYEHAKVLLIQD